MDKPARELIQRLEALLAEGLPRREQVEVIEELSALQARVAEGVDRLLTPGEAAAITGWRPGVDSGISPRWIYLNWRRLPAGVARKISYRKLRLHAEAWRKWLEKGEAIG